MSEQLHLIAAFLSQYVTANKGGLLVPPDPAFLREGIRLLLDNGVMTTEEIKLEALRDYSVIIPYYLLPQEEKA